MTIHGVEWLLVALVLLGWFRTLARWRQANKEWNHICDFNLHLLKESYDRCEKLSRACVAISAARDDLLRQDADNSGLNLSKLNEACDLAHEAIMSYPKMPDELETALMPGYTGGGESRDS